MSDLRTQYSQKFNVWDRILQTKYYRAILHQWEYATIYPYWMDLLQNGVIPDIKNMFNGNTQNIWLQQDGA